MAYGNKDNGAKETLVSKQKASKLLFSKKVRTALSSIAFNSETLRTKTALVCP